MERSGGGRLPARAGPQAARAAEARARVRRTSDTNTRSSLRASLRSATRELAISARTSGWVRVARAPRRVVCRSGQLQRVTGHGEVETRRSRAGHAGPRRRRRPRRSARAPGFEDLVASEGSGTARMRPRFRVISFSTAFASSPRRSITSSTNGERAAGCPSSSHERQLSVSVSVGRETQTWKR